MKIERCAALPECLEHRELADALGHDEQGHRILNAVTYAGITTPEQLAQQDDADLMDVPQLGRSRIVLIRERLAEAAGIRWAHPPLHDDDDLAEAEAAGIGWAQETARSLAAVLGASAHPDAKGWAEALYWFAARIHGGQVSLQADKEFRTKFGFAASDRREPGLLSPAEVAAGQPAPAQHTGDPAGRGL